MIYINFVELQSLMLHTSFKIIGLLVLEKKIFKVFFYLYSHGGHLGHVTLTIYINFLYPFLRMLHMKFGFDWPSGFMGEMFHYYGNIHVYSPGAGADNPPGAKIFH